MLGELEGVGPYDDVIVDAGKKILFGIELKFLSLAKLVKAKTIAGRNKDLAALDELNALLKIENERNKDGTQS